MRASPTTFLSGRRSLNPLPASTGRVCQHPCDDRCRRIGIDEERVRLVKHRSLKSFREIYERLKKISDTKVGKRAL